ncbi:JNK1/MAPK8-associated membrane protein-like [Gigantopelta aegis]|uniref:JNK1/MAPK8-associated membrane protein-like n=1 Tax=Gigantopelta aegis TaxID=1735272 RepID=UPI001B88A59B|nr:JNK1/MAPK8-associated membrane protein-like [Gigantopelta aegis]
MDKVALIIIIFCMCLMTVFQVTCDELKEVVETKLHLCPGLYCGRIVPEAQCGACPRGYQPDDQSLCVRCTGHLMLYDQLYLGFMALLSLVLHWFFIEFTTRRKKRVIILHLCALIESVLAAVLTLVMSDPMGSLNIRSCSVRHLSDWYTLLYNPSINYTTTLHCTQEMVYPLYSMVMIYYSLSLIFLLITRTFVSYKFVESRGTKSIYAALYFLPILIVVQAVFGGLLYYAFPYIILVVSVVTSAIHLASMKDQNIKDLIIDSFTSVRNLTILVGHWILHAYGIISLTELKNPSFELPLLALVPFPALFYVLTVRCSNPDELDHV